ncbi:MAG: AAA domain-containing protein [Candidatus Magasanikbacteria bacterium]|nr:AAA domain-containing protein [Candidatus Magasanikbacteria bacterium]
MMFEKNSPMDLVICSKCTGSGYINNNKCKNCSARGFGYQKRGKFLFWGEPLSTYHLKLKKSRDLLDKINIMAALVFSAGFFILFVWHVYTLNLYEDLFTFDYWLRSLDNYRIIFWLGVISVAYLIYRISILEREMEPVEKKSYKEQKMPEKRLTLNSWSDIDKLKKDEIKDISDSFTNESLQVLQAAYEKALKLQSPTVSILHIFLSLLESSKILGVFVRLGVSDKILINSLKPLLKKGDRPVIPILSDDVKQIISHSYELAFEKRQDFVEVTELLMSTVGQSEKIQELLYDLKIDQQKLSNVVDWIRIREKIIKQRKRQAKAAVHRSKHGMDRAMTAVATPFLNSFSQDLTLRAKLGGFSPCMARDKEINEIFRVIESGRQSVILVGDHGVGKKTIIEGIAQRMLEDNTPKRLQDKRLVQLSTSSLLAGVSVSGAQERLLRIMNEIVRAGNIILFVENLHDLVGSVDGGSEGLDVSETLAEYLGSGKFLTLATTVPNAYNKKIINSQIGTVFSKVLIKEMDVNQTIQVLESKVSGVEFKNNVFFTYDALEAASKMADQYIHEQTLPESAIEIMSETAAYVNGANDKLQLIKEDDVAKIITDKTGVKATAITEDESEKLLRLEDEMHNRVVGQDEAVSLVANALRRARAKMRSEDRPIANFLFLGPTGVGKTELAKTITSVYFGDEKRMIRIDMSEFQDKTAIYRLIGEPNKQGTGLLTEAIRQNPFSLLLLDELEKADPNVLNLFLQVFDDGRLTDSVGRVIDFTNTIIIATSNAGTDYVQEQLSQNVELEEIRQKMIRSELKQYYKPEFLNRFDAIVLFKSLTKEEIKKIASLMLKRVAVDLENKGIGLKVTDEALEALVSVGYDPEFGARPMRRAIQDYVENKLAELIISGKLNRRDVVVLGDGLEIKISRK